MLNLVPRLHFSKFKTLTLAGYTLSRSHCKLAMSELPSFDIFVTTPRAKARSPVCAPMERKKLAVYLTRVPSIILDMINTFNLVSTRPGNRTPGNQTNAGQVLLSEIPGVFHFKLCFAVTAGNHTGRRFSYFIPATAHWTAPIFTGNHFYSVHK